MSYYVLTSPTAAGTSLMNRMETASPAPGAPKRRRARKASGRYVGDDPTTPEVDEAWEASEGPGTTPSDSLE